MLLPAGVKPGLSAGKLKEAYYRSFDKKNRLAFLQAGRNYDSATMDTINDFMKIRQEMENINNKPLRRNNSSRNNNRRNNQDSNRQTAGGRNNRCQDDRQSSHRQGRSQDRRPARGTSTGA